MISLNWVKDYVDLDGIDLKQLAVDITKAGVNVEKVITNHIDNLVIGEVLECINHSESDHLHVCQVNLGNEITQIVCGAPNCRQGIKVIVAKPGTILPGNIEIKQSTIRGQVSNGMLCGLFEIGLEEKTEENYNKGIHELPNDAPVGEDPLVYMGLDDTIYELDVHKHRNNDCYYHIGFAYEIATILNKKVTLPVDNITEIADSINNHFTIEVKTDKCPYYLAKMVSNITIKESPDFIKRRLISAGMRPINNVVDISNYVMLEYGQPMHFFDYDKLGNKILVRDAKENEEITTLDNKKRVLSTNDIVITNGEYPVCIAGVMGGLNTDVDSTTKTILIESAIFNPISIRNTASKLDLKSEASIRYGKGLNFEYTDAAILRACHLLEKYADAKVLSDIVKYDNLDKSEKIVTFKGHEVNKMLGITITEEDIEKELNRLDFKFTRDNDTFTCTIPRRRLDIDPFINDIAEEIGRLYGYHNLVSTLPTVNVRRGQYIGDVKYRKLISNRLRYLGINETKNYTLVSPELSKLFDYEHKEKISLPNPMSIDKSIVRTTLLPSLVNVYEYNKARKVDNILVYEIAKTYDIKYNEDTKIALLLKGNYMSNDWQNSSMKVDFYLAKGIVENILDYMGLKNRYEFVSSPVEDMHPGMSAKILLDREEIGVIGRIHPTLNKDEIYLIEISLNKLMKPIKPIKYKPSSIYPEIKKDVCFIINKDTTCKILQDQIKKTGSRLLTNIELFDVYNISDTELSLAYTLTFSDPTRTLTDEEVMQLFNRIIDEVTNKCHAKLKSI